MSESNPYSPPLAAVSDTSVAAGPVADRRTLVPLWIKIFGWLFVVLGVMAAVTSVVQAVRQQPGEFTMFGLEYQGPPFQSMGLVLLAIILSLAISAYGLVRGKSWGLDACLATGYGGVAICLGVMAYAAVTHGSFTFRLEPLVQVPYLVKLHRIRPFWRASGQGVRAQA